MKLESFQNFYERTVNEVNARQLATTAAIAGSLFAGKPATAQEPPLKKTTSSKTVNLGFSALPGEIAPKKQNLRASENAFKIIRHFEGFYPNAYDDGDGTITIGYGTIEGVKMGDTITKSEAERRMRKEVEEKGKSIIKNIRVPLAQDQFDALISFSYNMGTGPLSSSTFSRYLNDGEYEKAINEFPRWINDGGKPSSGLLRRRKSEMVLFKTGNLVLTHVKGKKATPKNISTKYSNDNKKWIPGNYGSDKL